MAPSSALSPKLTEWQSHQPRLSYPALVDTVRSDQQEPLSRSLSVCLCVVQMQCVACRRRQKGSALESGRCPECPRETKDLGEHSGAGSAGSLWVISHSLNPVQLPSIEPLQPPSQWPLRVPILGVRMGVGRACIGQSSQPTSTGRHGQSDSPPLDGPAPTAPGTPLVVTRSKRGTSSGPAHL